MTEISTVKKPSSNEGMSDYEEEELTGSEKLSIVKQLILQSPPGQVVKVIDDLKKLVPSSILTREISVDLLRQYNIAELIPIADKRGEDNAFIVLSDEGQIDASHYIDSKRQKIVAVDHFLQKVDPKEAPTDYVSTGFDVERQAVEAAIEIYSSKKFSSGYHSSVLVNEGGLTIACCAQRINLRNFWSGQWNSKWRINKISSLQKMTLVGTIKLIVHYFENGNLQLHSEKKVSVELAPYASPEELAQMIVDEISQTETVIQTSLEEMYINMSSETFKEMRRVMPITQTKMDWSVHAHRTAKNLNK